MSEKVRMVRDRGSYVVTAPNHPIPTSRSHSITLVNGLLWRH